MGVSAQITGINELNRKIALMKSNFDGAPLAKVLRDAARPIQQQAKRNARRGPTGLVQRGISLFAGKKASKFGAAVVVKAKWKGTGAVFEEWGTKERRPPWQDSVPEGSKGPLRMKIPLSKLGAMARGMFRVKGGGRSARLAKVSGAFGFVFARTVAPMTGTRFFEAAVEAKMPDAQQAIDAGIQQLIQESIR